MTEASNSTGMQVLLCSCKVLGVKLLPVGQQIPRKCDKQRVKHRQKAKTRKKIQLTFRLLRANVGKYRESQISSKNSNFG